MIASTAITLKDIIAPVITGALAFTGVLLGLIVASKNISRQISTNYDLQAKQNAFTTKNRCKDILRQKAEDILDKFIKIDELKYKAHLVEFRLSNNIAKLIDTYQEYRFDLSRMIFSVLSLIDMYFPTLKETDSFKQGDIVMIQGSIANLVMNLRHYNDLVNDKLLIPPTNVINEKAKIVAQINAAYSEMQEYLTRSELVDLSKELRSLVNRELI